MKGQFTLEDWLDQMKQMKKMGPLSQIMDMLPGQMGQAARQADPKDIEKELQAIRSHHQFDDAARNAAIPIF